MASPFCFWMTGSRNMPARPTGRKPFAGRFRSSWQVFDRTPHSPDDIFGGTRFRGGGEPLNARAAFFTGDHFEARGHSTARRPRARGRRYDRGAWVSGTSRPSAVSRAALGGVLKRGIKQRTRRSVSLWPARHEEIACHHLHGLIILVQRRD